MKDVVYAITEEKYTLGNESRIAYGIAAYEDAKRNHTAIIVASIHDITSDKEGLSKHVDDCNCLELSIVHLFDSVEDSLSD